MRQHNLSTLKNLGGLAENIMNHNPNESNEVLAYCRHCLRDDYHELMFDATTRTILFELTMGLVRVIEPIRCCACGNSRTRGFESLSKCKSGSKSVRSNSSVDDRPKANFETLVSRIG